MWITFLVAAVRLPQKALDAMHLFFCALNISGTDWNQAGSLGPNCATFMSQRFPWDQYISFSHVFWAINTVYLFVQSKEQTPLYQQSAILWCRYEVCLHENNLWSTHDLLLNKNEHAYANTHVSLTQMNAKLAFAIGLYILTSKETSALWIDYCLKAKGCLWC